jgi:hypothetical protein
MQSRCAKHLFEGAEDLCGKCGLEFCGECLVYAFGPKKPPLCIPCAVAAAGIRAAAGNRPVVNKQEMKRLQKERNSAFKRFRRERKKQPAVAEAPEPVAPMPPPPAPAPAPAPLLPAAEVAQPVEPIFEPAPSSPFAEEPFVTEPAYVDPSPTTMPIRGV